MPISPGPILITGTSSGIGHATALKLAKQGRLVYATARRVSALTDLAQAGAHTLALDVTDEESMRTAVATIEAESGPISALVNNAGYGEYGTVEETDLDRVRRQFETNFFGLARMSQLVLPGMRSAGRGRIVNVSSMGGRLVFPGGGYYHSSKYAVEALSDALRFEVREFGVDVVLIEPGLIRTAFGATAADTLSTSAGTNGPYAHFNKSVDKQMADSYRSKLMTAPADAVASAIVTAVTTARPRRRYVITPTAKALVHTRRLLGGAFWDAFLRTQFK